MLHLFLACLLTVVIETLFFVGIGCRDRVFLLLCVLANAATNLSLNLILQLLYTWGVDLTVAVYPLEALVVAVGLRRREDLSEHFRLMEGIWDEYQVYLSKDRE